MRGHEKIIEARIAGKTPSFVFINDFPCATDWFEHGDYATVCTYNDAISSLDFRFLFNLRVSVSACTESRAKSLFELIKDCGATTVAACHVDPAKRALNQTGWASVHHKEAGNGVH